MLRAKHNSANTSVHGQRAAHSVRTFSHSASAFCVPQKTICCRNNAFRFCKKMTRVEFHIYLELLALVFQPPKKNMGNAFAIDLIRAGIAYWSFSRSPIGWLRGCSLIPAGKSRVCQHFRLLTEERGTKITPCHFLGGRLSSHQTTQLEKIKCVLPFIRPQSSACAAPGHLVNPQSRVKACPK